MQNKGNQLSWIVVKDLKKAVKFFTETLGLELLVYDESCDGWAELGSKSAKDSARLGIASESKETKEFNMHPGQNAIVCFTVDNLEKSRLELMQKGVTLLGDIVEVPGEVKMQLIRDPDGNLFHITELLTKK